MKLKEKKENIINFEDRAEEINISSDKKLIEKIISKLKNYLIENKNIPGISAPQLGYNKRKMGRNGVPAEMSGNNASKPAAERPGAGPETAR